MRTSMTTVALVIGCWLVLCGAAGAQEAETDAADLAKVLQNPIAAVITLPIQINYNTGVGEYDRTQFTMNIQPVIPFEGENWNVITRTIIPVTSVPVGETDSIFGIGDATLSLWWSPAKPGALIWGIGPAFGLPSASNPEVLGSGKWGLGPTAVVLAQPGSWTIGALASNLWSVAGDDDRADYSFFLCQYFINLGLGGGWTFGTAPIVTANWEAESGNQWTIPWGLQISKLMMFGSLPTNLMAGYYTNSEHPEGGAENQVRVQINFMFPTG